MLNLATIKTYAQKTRFTCGPAALRTVLSCFNIEKDEQSLAKLCGTTSNGTKPAMLKKALEKLGFQTKVGSGGRAQHAWKTLNYWVNEKKLPVIVDWFSISENGGDGHYSVVLALTKNEITIADPEFDEAKERMRKIPWLNFLRVWFDWKGDYLESPKNLIIRSWLVGFKAKGYK